MILLLIASSALIVYLFLWYSFIKKMTGGGYSIGGRIAKIIFLLPFWLIFFGIVFTSYFPEIELMVKPAYIVQEISFENDTKSEMEIMMIKRIMNTNDWVPAYKLNFRNHSPFIKLNPGEADLFKYKGDEYDAVYAILSNDKDPVYYTINAKPIPILLPPTIQKVYFSEIAPSRAKSANVLLQDEGFMLAFLLIGIQGFWYHCIRVRKFIQKAVAIFIALNVTFFAGYIALNITRIILYFIF